MRPNRSMNSLTKAPLSDGTCGNLVISLKSNYDWFRLNDFVNVSSVFSHNRCNNHANYNPLVGSQFENVFGDD